MERVDHRPKPALVASSRIVFTLLVIGMACLAPILLYRLQDSTATRAETQRRVLESLKDLVQSVKEDQAQLMHSRDAVTKELVEKMQTQLDSLQRSLDNSIANLSKTQRGLDNTTSTLVGAMTESTVSRRERARQGIVADYGRAVITVNEHGTYVASPSILKLDSGRLLVVLERSPVWGSTSNSLQKLVMASDDGGGTWTEVSKLGPMNWPQIFRCASGVYVIGTQRPFSKNNNVVISRMLDEGGEQWSEPSQLTSGWSVVAANTGVDVSAGRVTKSFELIPSMAEVTAETKLREAVDVPIAGGVGGASWQNSPVLAVAVESVEGLVRYSMVSVPGVKTAAEGSKERLALYFRILSIDAPSRMLELRLERFNHYWATEPMTLEAGRMLHLGSSSNVYGGVDWVASAMNADENADLTLPSSWSFPVMPVGNPASVHSNELRALFDIAFRANASARDSIVGFKLKGITNEEEAWEAGFGSVYWMEGVITREMDRHGSSGKLVSIMRVNNDWMCDLAALVAYDDILVPSGGGFHARFMRYTNIPGLGVGHPAVVYDTVSDLYWMVSNVNRDSTRRWKQPANVTGEAPALHITPFSKCEVDRTTLSLYYSPNLVDWAPAGIVDRHVILGRHFTYPHMVIDGNDLLVVTRASFRPWPAEADASLKTFYNNHNSNSIAFHRVRDFRKLADTEWALYQGPYSAMPRRFSSQEGSEDWFPPSVDAARAQGMSPASDREEAARQGGNGTASPEGGDDKVAKVEGGQQGTASDETAQPGEERKASGNATEEETKESGGGGSQGKGGQTDAGGADAGNEGGSANATTDAGSQGTKDAEGTAVGATQSTDGSQREGAGGGTGDKGGEMAANAADGDDGGAAGSADSKGTGAGATSDTAKNGDAAAQQADGAADAGGSARA